MLRKATKVRANGNGTAGTILVFEGEKLNDGVAKIVTYVCVIEWPLRAVHLSLGYGEVFFGLFESSSIQSRQENRG